MSRWSEDTTLKFVTQYLQHDCLWNIKSSLYRNKQTKQVAYIDLKNTMNISKFGEKEIKLKIKNIRSTYSQELKKIKEGKTSGAGTDTLYVPSIKWFNILNGALRNITSILTESKSNLPSKEISHADTNTNKDTEKNRSAEDSNFREPEPKSKPPPTKKNAQLTSMVGQIKEITETSNATRTEEDNEFDVFGKHVALQLKGLPLLLALQTQEHIQLYINIIRRQHLQNISKQNRKTRSFTPLSYDSQDSPYSSNYNDNHNYEKQHVQETPSSVTSEEQSLQETPFTPSTHDSDLRDILSAAMESANV